MRGNEQHTNRKSSADHGFRSNSLEPDLSAFFLRRRKTDRSAGDSEPNSSPISPSFASPKPRPTYRSGDSNRSIPNLEIHSSSVGSSLSGTSRYPLNVSDWNEKVVRETTPITTQPLTRHPVDPPRPAREGCEWVWFPDGYWAERVRVDDTSRNRKAQQKWFPHSNRHAKSNISGNSKVAAIDHTKGLPIIRIGGSKSAGNSPRESSEVGDHTSETVSRTSKGSKLRSGLKYMSPAYPHFISPSGEREGLYCKTRRGLGVAPKRKVCFGDSEASPAAGRASQTTMTLEGASNYFDRVQRDRDSAHRLPQLAQPQPPPSPDFRSRIRGLAPWHRRSSNESIMSASSSVYKILMGNNPAATPYSDGKHSPDRRYKGNDGNAYQKVEISDFGGPNFLPSEATRLPTPPITEEEKLSLCSDLSTPDIMPDSEDSPPNLSGGAKSSTKDARSSTEWWETRRAAAMSEKIKIKGEGKFKLDLPEHLPSSPLCPKNPKNKSGGTGICVYHGRRRGVSLLVTDTSERDGPGAGALDEWEWA